MTSLHLSELPDPFILRRVLLEDLNIDHPVVPFAVALLEKIRAFAPVEDPAFIQAETVNTLPALPAAVDRMISSSVPSNTAAFPTIPVPATAPDAVP